MSRLERDLARMLEGMPPDGAVTLPVQWLQKRLDPDAEVRRREALDDLTVPDLAEALQRSESSVRDRLAAGEIEGAYKLGREWRVPRRAVRRWLDGLAEDGGGPAEGEGPQAVDLSGWREEREATGGSQ